MRRASVALVVLVWVVVAAGQASVKEHPPPPKDGDVTASRSDIKNAETETTKEEDKNHSGDVVTKEEQSESEGHDLAAETKKKFFLGRYSTTTEVAVVMVTSTVFFSCLSGTSAALCLGRRRKKDLMPLTELHFDHEERYHLDSSQDTDAERLARSMDEGLEAPAGKKDEKGEDKFLGFSVWTRVRTTSTVTMLFTDTNTTIRLSYYCQAGNLQLPANACG